MFKGCFNWRSLLRKKEKGRVPIDEIPFHLQVKIAQKMEYIDFHKFILSSKSGAAVGMNFTGLHSVDTEGVYIDGAKIKIYRCRMDWDWDPKKKSPKFARLRIDEYIRLGAVDIDIFDYFLNSNHFFGVNTSLYIVDPLFKVSQEQFAKLLSVFDVTSFTATLHSKISPELTSLSQFHQIKKFDVSGSIDEKDFLALRARHIRYEPLSNSQTSPGTTLNAVLKQWYDYEREIDIISIKSAVKVKAETVFMNIPFTVLWTRYTHNESILSEFERLTLNAKDYEYFLITRGDEQLFVRLGFHEDTWISAEVVKDEEILLRKELELGFSERIPGGRYCYYDHTEDYCIIHGINDFCQCCRCHFRRNKVFE